MVRGLLTSPAAWAVAFVLMLMAGLPLWAQSEYHLSYGINVVQYAVLATAWALFSGPTRYISLATTAFFGVGAYTVAVFAETMRWFLLLVVAALVGSVL